MEPPPHEHPWVVKGQHTGPNGSAVLETHHVYTLYGEIASGGMATIRLARQLGPHGLSRLVAVKMLHARYAEDAEFISMFRDEIRLASRVVHPNVVPTLDVMAVGDELLLAMEYIHGESVAGLIRAGGLGGIPPEIASTIMVGVLHGLHAAHQARSEHGEPLHIIHRDVSPQNIMLGVDGAARLLDFGIAHAVGRMQTTRFGHVKGKLAYMAPEQLLADVVDRRADIYSASVTLWEMLAGRKLFQGRNQDKVAQMILNKSVERPGLFQRGIPSALDAIVLRGLQREPRHRYQSAREMAIALEQQTKTVSATVLGDWVSHVWGAAGAARDLQIREIERTEVTAYLVRPTVALAEVAASPARESQTGARTVPRQWGAQSLRGAFQVGRGWTGLPEELYDPGETTCAIPLSDPSERAERADGAEERDLGALDYAVGIQPRDTPLPALTSRWRGLMPLVPLALATAASIMIAEIPSMVGGGRSSAGPAPTAFSPALAPRPARIEPLPAIPKLASVESLLPATSDALDGAGGAAPVASAAPVQQRPDGPPGTESEATGPGQPAEGPSADERSVGATAPIVGEGEGAGEGAGEGVSALESPSDPVTRRAPVAGDPSPRKVLKRRPSRRGHSLREAAGGELYRGSRQLASATPTPPAPARRPMAGAARPETPAPADCTPPFVVDASGIKHFKLACL